MLAAVARHDPNGEGTDPDAILRSSTPSLTKDRPRLGPRPITSRAPRARATRFPRCPRSHMPSRCRRAKVDPAQTDGLLPPHTLSAPNESAQDFDQVSSEEGCSRAHYEIGVFEALQQYGATQARARGVADEATIERLIENGS